MSAYSRLLSIIVVQYDWVRPNSIGPIVLELTLVVSSSKGNPGFGSTGTLGYIYYGFPLELVVDLP